MTVAALTVVACDAGRRGRHASREIARRARSRFGAREVARRHTMLRRRSRSNPHEFEVFLYCLATRAATERRVFDAASRRAFGEILWGDDGGIERRNQRPVFDREVAADGGFPKC
ncbi:MAG TPA: hypothetical protein VNF99_03090 [Stellaceae bacterium]|nr:hypothetical protein [Stellaceae bacterium]